MFSFTTYPIRNSGSLMFPAMNEVTREDRRQYYPGFHHHIQVFFSDQKYQSEFFDLPVFFLDTLNCPQNNTRRLCIIRVGVFVGNVKQYSISFPNLGHCEFYPGAFFLTLCAERIML